MRVRRAVAAARAVPCGARAAGYAPRPLGVESSGHAAPHPATGECGSVVAPWPVTVECGKVKSVARARGAPRQFATHAVRRFSKVELQADALLAELPAEVLAVATAGVAGSQLPSEAAGAFARCALLVKGGPDGTTRKGLRAWRSLRAEAARYGLEYFGLCPPPRAWWHMWEEQLQLRNRFYTYVQRAISRVHGGWQSLPRSLDSWDALRPVGLKE